MRSDMNKCLVERARLGANHSEKNQFRNRDYRCDLEDLPQRESMKGRWKDRKILNEFLAPLERFLTSMVGQNWDDIYSEICAQIKLNNTVQRHILEHLGWMVETNTEIGPDGNVWKRDKHYHEPIVANWYKDIFYLCPNTKILMVLPRVSRHSVSWKQKDDKSSRLKALSDDCVLVKHEGIWYEAFLKDLPPPKTFILDGKHYSYPQFHFMKEMFLCKTVGDCFEKYNVKKYCYKKKQMSGGELKKYGLKNN